MGKVPLIKVQGSQNHHLFKRGDIYWVRIYKAGKGRLEHSLDTDVITDARIARDKKIAEFVGTKAKFAGKGLLTEDQFALFAATKEGKSENTKYSMNNSWDKHLKDHFGGLLLDEITETEWHIFVNNKRKTDSDRKFFNDRKWLQGILNWAYREGKIPRLPKLEDVDPELTPGQVYNDNELGMMLNGNDDFSGVNETLGLQIIAAVTQGMRHKEIWSLEWWQINWDKKTIFLPSEKVKTRKARTFVMSEQFYKGLLQRRETMIEAYGDELPSWVFPNAIDLSKPEGRFGQKSAWDRMRKKLKITKRFHWLRHTFLTRAFKVAVNPALICTYAGLSLEEANRTYLHLDHDDTAPVAGLVKLEMGG